MTQNEKKHGLLYCVMSIHTTVHFTHRHYFSPVILIYDVSRNDVKRYWNKVLLVLHFPLHIICSKKMKNAAHLIGRIVR